METFDMNEIMQSDIIHLSEALIEFIPELNDLLAKMEGEISESRSGEQISAKMWCLICLLE